MSRQTGSLLVLLAALLWGLSFYFQKAAMSHVGPLLFTGLRAVIAAAVLTPFAFRERVRGVGGKGSVFGYGILGGVLFLAAGGLQQAGMATATLTNTAFLTALYVVITPFLLWLLKGDQPAMRAWAAAAIAFSGIWLMGGGTLGAFSQGDMLVAISSVFWSLLMVVTSASGKAGKPVQYTFTQFVTVAVLALPLAVWHEPLEVGRVMAAALPILYVGAIASALTYAIMAIVVRHIDASSAAILLSTEVLFAAGLGYVLLGERPGPINFAGAALVFGAVLLIQTRNRKAN